MLYYVLNDILDPPVLLHLTALAALAWLWRRRQESRRRLLLLTIPFVVYTLLSLPVVCRLAQSTLERDYPTLEHRPDDVQAIVVLSGYLRPLDSNGTKCELGEDTLYRCVKALDLYRDGPRCPILVSGGKVHASDPGPTLAAAMRDFLMRQGVAASDVLVEEQSRTTYENAIECRKILQEHGLRRVLLVTDTTHLSRAEGCFIKQGVDVVPCGCRYSFHGPLSLGDFLPNPVALRGFEVVWHEWLGWVWYRMNGRL